MLAILVTLGGILRVGVKIGGGMLGGGGVEIEALLLWEFPIENTH